MYELAVVMPFTMLENLISGRNLNLRCNIVHPHFCTILRILRIHWPNCPELLKISVILFFQVPLREMLNRL